MPERIGIFICKCGPTIKDGLDLDDLLAGISKLPDVAYATDADILCSENGRNSLVQTIEQHRLSRIVVAGCSPKEHELTFRKVLDKAGLNPYLLQIANIREQCTWVTGDRQAATQKARALILAAVERVKQHEPLQGQEYDSHPDVLVVGAGMAGISAALDLAQNGRRVHLVDKAPFIGGKAVLYEDLVPGLACAACAVSPLLTRALHHDRITVHTLSRIGRVKGFLGNFTVQIRHQARYVDTAACIGCGACIEDCPVSVPNAFNMGLDQRKAIHIPHPGALPHLAVVDKTDCLRFKGRDCDRCEKSCAFQALDFTQTDTAVEIQVGAIVLATGFDLFDPAAAFQYGRGRVANVLTGLAFERMLNSDGPTGGAIALRDGRTPQRLAFIHCVGSRSPEHHTYCSAVCCQYLRKQAQMSRRKLPDAEIVHFFTDLCLPGPGAVSLWPGPGKNAKETFTRLQGPHTVAIAQTGGVIRLTYRDVTGSARRMETDMVVLATAMTPPDGTAALAEQLDLPLTADGFPACEHDALSPVTTVREGIFLAGCIQGPKDIPASIAQGQAAAGRILATLTPGKRLRIEPVIAHLKKKACSGCGLCIDMCPYGAFYREDSGLIAVEPLLCRGCGTCVPACPGSALDLKHFSDGMIGAEITALADRAKGPDYEM